uniref:Uncharacterized protein n=1 Tax=Brassica campestris TaxID=3711 RepID=A0A3P5Z2J0_BRACM|nr:unnamed protein product [Brassica rapa]
MCSSLYESHNPASTHLLRSTMIAESIPFSSDKDASEGSTSAVENNTNNSVSVALSCIFVSYVRLQGVVRVPTVLVRDIWVFEKSLFHTGACCRLCGRIKFPSKDKIQPAL